MIRDDLMIEVENAVKAEMQAYQDPSRIDDLRAYHIPDHGTQVANEVLATDCIVRKTPINFQKALALAALAHDVVPPDFSTHIDINRPWPFTYRRFQIFDGQSEEASLNWFVRSFGRHFDDQTIELIGDCIIATTTERDSYGVVTQKDFRGERPKSSLRYCQSGYFGTSI